MNDAIAISVVNLSKCYHLYESPMDRLKQALWGGGQHKEFAALRDITFSVRKGEAVGIIGRNGSGKSTLLQIISGTLKPTTGEVEVNGRVAALLELGSGFNPEYTGRENVFLNGAILGLSRKEIEVKFDEIAAFADIGDFIDQPVKEYSSGMMMRLAFAVQVVVEPDILIVDEALSVGDFFFQQKCLRRIRQLRERGTTLLFVSHDMGTVRDLCEQAIYLRHGEVMFAGGSSGAIWRYFQEDSRPELSQEEMCFPVTDVGSDLLEFRKVAYWTNDDETGGGASPARILGVSLRDKSNVPVLKVKMAEELTFQVLFQAHRDVTCSVDIEIKNRYDQVVTSNGSYTYGIEPFFLKAGEIGEFELKMVCMLEAGQYTFQASIGTGDEHSPNRGSLVGVTPWLGPFSISWDYENERAPFLGMFGVPLNAKFSRVGESNDTGDNC